MKANDFFRRGTFIVITFIFFVQIVWQEGPPEFRLTSALHDQCSSPTSTKFTVVRPPVRGGYSSRVFARPGAEEDDAEDEDGKGEGDGEEKLTTKEANLQASLDYVDCDQTPYSKAGFSVAPGRDDLLIYENPPTSRTGPRERILVERTCSLRDSCKRSFVVRTAKGFVDVKCGEQLRAGMASPMSAVCGLSDFYGLHLLVQPEAGFIIVGPVDAAGLFHGNCIIAAYLPIQYCTSTVAKVRQPELWSIGLHHGDYSAWTKWTWWYWPTFVPTDAMFNPSTPELKLLASVITTISKEERIREEDATVVVSWVWKIQSVLATGALIWKISTFPPTGYYRTTPLI